MESDLKRPCKKSYGLQVRFSQIVDLIKLKRNANDKFAYMVNFPVDMNGKLANYVRTFFLAAFC